MYTSGFRSRSNMPKSNRNKAIVHIFFCLAHPHHKDFVSPYEPPSPLRKPYPNVPTHPEKGIYRYSSATIWKQTARHSRTHHVHGWRHAVAYQDALPNNKPLFVKNIVISGACDQHIQRQQFFGFHGNIFLLLGMGPVPCAVGRCAPQNKTHRHVEWDVSCIIQRSIGGVCSQSRRFYI